MTRIVTGPSFILELEEKLSDLADCKSLTTRPYIQNRALEALTAWNAKDATRTLPYIQRMGELMTDQNPA